MLKYLGTECYDAYNELSNDSGKLTASTNTERRGMCRKTLATGFPTRGKDSMSSHSSVGLNIFTINSGGGGTIHSQVYRYNFKKTNEKISE